MFRGIYRHIKSGNLYKIIGIARNVEKPDNQIVVYKQLYRSNLRGRRDVELPKGSIWTRPLDDFIGKFKKMK